MVSPLVYEINTRCWLPDLSRRLGRPVTLATVPDDEFETWQALGFTHIWLLGLWPTGPVSRRQALEDPSFREAVASVLPDWTEADVAGSPFAVADYRVPEAYGGEAALQSFRNRLRERGMRLLLDFIPNHLGLDHAWLRERPGLFVQAAGVQPGVFRHETVEGPVWLAHGRDPNFPTWVDTAQLDYRRPETHCALRELFRSVMVRCDGVRCDMAMLLLREVFERDWAAFPVLGTTTDAEFWPSLIGEVRLVQPDFLFLAEVYWDLEARLQAVGFEYTYDKRLYDYLVRRNRGEVRRHLAGVSPTFLAASAHFLENHDEVRVASVLSPAEHKAAALLLLGLPGLRLIHEGQLRGARRRVPVQLSRRPAEPEDQEVATFYDSVLRLLKTTRVGNGRGELLPVRPAWPGNPSDQNVVVTQWQGAGKGFDLVAVNLAGDRSQAYIALTIEGLNFRNWRMRDLLGVEVYERYGDDLQRQGLYLDLAPYAAQLFRFEPVE